MSKRKRMAQRLLLVTAAFSVTAGCGSPLDLKCWLNDKQGGYRPAERVGTSSVGRAEDGAQVLVMGAQCGFMCRDRYNTDPCFDCAGNNIHGCKAIGDKNDMPMVVRRDGKAVVLLRRLASEEHPGQD